MDGLSDDGKSPSHQGLSSEGNGHQEFGLMWNSGRHKRRYVPILGRAQVANVGAISTFHARASTPNPAIKP
jgi:hypothetical protein